MIANYIKSLIRPLSNPNYFRFSDTFLSVKRQKQAKLAKKLKQGLQPTYLQVIDTTLGSSSCGQMYKIIIESPFFQGKSRVAQHQMVSQCLGDDLNQIHGFNLKTKVSKKEEKGEGQQKEQIKKQ